MTYILFTWVGFHILHNKLGITGVCYKLQYEISGFGASFCVKDVWYGLSPNEQP